jgi:hypothetical protein
MRFKRPSPALVIATIALFFALGGTGYAVSKLPKNSVTTVQVRDHSLLKRDFKAGQLPRGAPGAQGEPGTTGPKGDKGDKGDIGPSNARGFEFCSSLFCQGDPHPAIDIAWAHYSDAPPIATMNNLAAGSYVLTAHMTFLGPASSRWRVTCSLQVPLVSPAWASGAAATVGDLSADDSYVTIPITTSVPSSMAIPEGASAGLKCIRDDGEGENPKLIYASISAVKVGYSS